MRSEYYLVLTYKEKYKPLGVRACIKQPHLGPNEISIKCKIEIPEQIFKRPQLQSNLVISEDQVSPHVIDVETINNIEDAIRKESGINISLTLEPTTEEGKADRNRPGLLSARGWPSASADPEGSHHQ